MIDGPIKDMIDRNHARQDFKPPPYLADRRPLALSSGRTVVALFCSDPRLDPRKILVLDGTPGPVVSVIRVPGGRSAHAIKALAGMQAVLNSCTILVVHHTGKSQPASPVPLHLDTDLQEDCGMTHVTDQEIRDHLLELAPDERATIEKETFGEIRGSYVHFAYHNTEKHAKKHISFEDSIKEDINILRNSSWIKKNTRIIGLKYETHKGTLHFVDDYQPEGWPDLKDLAG